jgi:hypothetical protein
MQSLIFKEIKSSNKQYTFGRGKYGEFEVIIMDNGYINATKLCALGGKQLFHWMETRKGKEMISYYESILVFSRTAKIIIKGGDNPEVTGTYMPNELITHVASWVSVKFAFMVSDIVKEYMIREYKESNRVKDTRIDFLIKQNEELLKVTRGTHTELLDTKEMLQVQEEHYELKLDDNAEKMDDMADSIQLISEHLNVKKERYVPRADVAQFIFIKLNKTKYNKDVAFEYQVMRVKKRGRTASFKKNPGSVVFELSDHANPINLFDRIKLDTELRTLVDIWYNSISFREETTIELFESHVMRIHNERLTIKTV